MSLEPHWFSTIYGAMFTVGEVLEAFAFVIALLVVLSAMGSAEGVRDTAALSRSRHLMFAFTYCGRTHRFPNT